MSAHLFISCQSQITRSERNLGLKGRGEKKDADESRKGRWWVRKTKKKRRRRRSRNKKKNTLEVGEKVVSVGMLEVLTRYS